MSPDNQASNYVRTTQARGFIRDAIAAEQQFEPQKTADIGELYMALGFIEMTLAENFCNGIPLGSTIKRRRGLHARRTSSRARTPRCTTSRSRTSTARWRSSARRPT